jgi:hypothetical protein
MSKMSKKNIVLILNLLVLNTASVFSMSEADKRTIRKELYFNYQTGCINAATLAEDELSLLEVIERDIQILNQHQDLVQRKINLSKRGFTHSLVGGIFLGGINMISGSIARAQSKYINSLWNGDGNSSIKLSDYWVDIQSYFGAINEKHKAQYDIEKFKQLCKDYPELPYNVLIASTAGIVTVITGLWCIKKVYDMCRHNSFSVSMYIAKCKARIDRDQAIIVRLKEVKRAIKHNLSI